MKKLTICEKTFTAGAKSGGFFGKGFGTNSFNLSLGLSMMANAVDNITSMIAQDEYNKNPNPKYKLNSYDWNGNNFRLGASPYRSSYNVLGGW